jgi:hypothetical protein
VQADKVPYQSRIDSAAKHAAAPGYREELEDDERSVCFTMEGRPQRQRSRRIVGYLGLSHCFSLSSGGRGVPTDQVRGTVDRVVTILQNPTLKSPDKRHERREQLSLSARFDFAEMARRSLGAEWRRLTPPQQHEFVELVADLLRDP